MLDFVNMTSRDYEDPLEREDMKVKYSAGIPIVVKIDSQLPR
jgi:hypothetical protein